MENLRVHRILADVPRLTYREKALGLAAVAALAPTLTACLLGAFPHAFTHGLGRGFVLILGGGISVAALWALGELLLAVGDTARQLESCVDLASARSAPERSPDEVVRMMADIRAVAERLESVRHRLANRHPVTGVATREPFFAAIGKDLATGATTGLLGVVRFSQYDRLAAVDRPGAERALQAFASRLMSILGQTRPLAQVDRDSFAVWFRDADGPKGAIHALKSLATSRGDLPARRRRRRHAARPGGGRARQGWPPVGRAAGVLLGGELERG